MCGRRNRPARAAGPARPACPAHPDAAARRAVSQLLGTPSGGQGLLRNPEILPRPSLGSEDQPLVDARVPSSSHPAPGAAAGCPVVTLGTGLLARCIPLIRVHGWLPAGPWRLGSGRAAAAASFSAAARKPPQTGTMWFA